MVANPTTQSSILLLSHLSQNLPQGRVTWDNTNASVAGRASISTATIEPSFEGLDLIYFDVSAYIV